MDLTAKGGEYAAIQGNTVQITGGAKVEAVGDVRALALDVFDSEVTASGGLIFFVPFEKSTSDREEELQAVWGGEPEAHIAIVDSTVAVEGMLAYHALGGGRLDVWDSKVTAGGIGGPTVNIFDGEVEARGGDFGAGIGGGAGLPAAVVSICGGTAA